MGWRFRFYGNVVLVYWEGSLTHEWIFAYAKTLQEFTAHEEFLLAVVHPQ